MREFSRYCWDTRAKGDRVRKEYDHAMDEIRYFAVTVAAREHRQPFGVGFVERNIF